MLTSNVISPGRNNESADHSSNILTPENERALNAMGNFDKEVTHGSLKIDKQGEGSKSRNLHLNNTSVSQSAGTGRR